MGTPQSRRCVVRAMACRTVAAWDSVQQPSVIGRLAHETDGEEVPGRRPWLFRGNEYVRVVGFILRPSRRIQAFELYLVTPWFPTEPP
jgi:hypothetical protein